MILAERPTKTQGEQVTQPARRHHGQLRNHSLLPQANRFSSTELHAGSTFTAEVDRLISAVENWKQCIDEFQEKLSEITLSTHITDGSGPVAHALGTRFDHRIGTAGGIGYATDAYLAKLRQILEGLNQTTVGYVQSEETAANTVAGR
jgi:hypothetical protein